MTGNGVNLMQCCCYCVNEGCPKSKWTFVGKIHTDIRDPWIYSVSIYLKAPCGEEIEIKSEEFQSDFEEVEYYVRTLTKTYKELWDAEAKISKNMKHECVYK